MKFVDDQTDKQADKHNLPTVWPLHTHCKQNEQKHIHYLVASHRNLFPILVSLVHFFRH